MPKPQKPGLERFCENLHFCLVVRSFDDRPSSGDWDRSQQTPTQSRPIQVECRCQSQRAIYCGGATRIFTYDNHVTPPTTFESDVTTQRQPVKTHFHPVQDRAQVVQILRDGCAHMRPAFDIESINLI